MPRIPTYEQQLVPNVNPGASRAARSIAGDGLQLAGRQVVDYAKEQLDTEGRIWAATASSQADLDMTAHLQEFQQAAKPGAPNFTPEFLKSYDEYAEGALKNAPSNFARNLLAANIARSREAYGRAAMVWEASERTRYTGEQIDTGVQNSAKLTYNNPDLFDQEMGKWESTIRGSAIDEASKSKLRDLARKNLAWSTVTGRIDRDPMGWADQNLPKPAAAAAPAPKPSEVSQSNLAALQKFKLTTEQDSVLQFVASGDQDKAAFLRTVLNIENRGFGAVRNDAMSEAGSMGPFQFTASTGKQYGLASDADRKDFAKSAQAASKYYDDLNKRYNGNVIAMIAEYNGGIKAGRAIMEGRDPPAKETRDYVAMARFLLNEVQIAPTEAAAVQQQPQMDRGAAWNLLTWQEQQKALEYAERKSNEVRQQMQVDLRYETQNVEAMARTGVAPEGPARTREEFMRAFKDPKTADYEWSRYSTARQTAESVAALSTKSSADLVTIAQERPDPNDPNFAVKAANQQIRAQAAAEIVRARQDDPVAYAIQTKDFGFKPLNMQDQAAFSEELKRRSAAVPGMSQKYGKAAVLSKQEASVMAQQLELMPADRKVEQLEVMRSSIADDAVYANVLNSIRPDSPVTALVGNIAAAGSKENARMIARGEDLLNPTKGGKATDGGKGAAFPMPTESLMRQAWVDAVGDSYRGYPDAEGTAYQAFKAYYAAAAAQRGLNDPKASPDDRIIRDAIKASTGGVAKWRTDWFGNDTPSAYVVLPYGMDEDVFRDRVTAEWLRVREAAGYPKTDVGDIGLYNTGANGEYMVISGTSWLPGKDGKPVILRVK